MTVPGAPPARPSARAAGGRSARGGDAGVTLIEVVVALGLMAIVMAIVTGSILAAQRTFRQTTAIADAEAQVTRVFQRLDSSLRYAAAVQPGTVDGGPGLRYLITAGTPRCHELWLAGDQLRTRVWPPGGVRPAGSVLATGVRAPAGAGSPFTVTGGGTGNPEATAAPPRQVQVNLTTSADAAPRALTATFTARNAALGPENNTLADCGG